MTKNNEKSVKKLGGFLATLAVAMSTAAYAQDTIPMATGADISTMCGDKPTIVGLVDGAGGNTWRKTVVSEFRDEASKCPNITEAIYVDGAGDPAKTNSDINSLVAQGVNVMIIFPDFGPAMIPAMRSALQAGVVVVPYNGNPGGTNGVDYSFNVYQDFGAAGRKWAAWLDENLGEDGGKVLYFSGPAGNDFSANFMDGIKSALKNYPKIELLQDTHVATNWIPADAQKATTGIVAQHGGFDAFMSDFGPVSAAVVRTMLQAGLDMPLIASLASTNELNCMYTEAKAAGDQWSYMTLEGTTTIVRNSLRRGMAEYQGTENPDPLGTEAFVWADTTKGIDPVCDPKAPLDADLSGLLSEDQMQAVFNQ